MSNIVRHVFWDPVTDDREADVAFVNGLSIPPHVLIIYCVWFGIIAYLSMVPLFIHFFLR